MSTQVASAMPPPAARPAAGVKRKREVVTLDEDEWTSRIEAIIQRDYYPDLPKLQNKLEWLQVSRRDTLGLCRRWQHKLCHWRMCVQYNTYTVTQAALHARTKLQAT